MATTFTTSMFARIMDYIDNPAGGYRSELTPAGTFLGFSGALAAFLLPVIHNTWVQILSLIENSGNHLTGLTCSTLTTVSHLLHCPKLRKPLDSRQ